MSAIDHHPRDGVSGMPTIADGKLMTYRLMAERTVSIVCEEVGEKRECRVALEAVSPTVGQKFYTIGHRLEEIERKNMAPSHGQIIHECELVTHVKFEEIMDTLPDARLDDARHQMRLGVDPCWGGFCSQCVTGIACERGNINSLKVNELFGNSLKNHWIGL